MPSGTIGNELVAYGRKPADYDPAAFQGIHARYVLVIIDEAGGVPKSIFDAVDALATNIDARVVAVGNPDDPGSHFAAICKPGSGWHVETISAFDTPAERAVTQDDPFGDYDEGDSLRIPEGGVADRGTVDLPSESQGDQEQKRDQGRKGPGR